MVMMMEQRRVVVILMMGLMMGKREMGDGKMEQKEKVMGMIEGMGQKGEWMRWMKGRGIQERVMVCLIRMVMIL